MHHLKTISIKHTSNMALRFRCCGRTTYFADTTAHKARMRCAQGINSSTGMAMRHLYFSAVPCLFFFLYRRIFCCSKTIAGTSAPSLPSSAVHYMHVQHCYLQSAKNPNTLNIQQVLRWVLYDFTFYKIIMTMRLFFHYLLTFRPPYHPQSATPLTSPFSTWHTRHVQWLFLEL